VKQKLTENDFAELTSSSSVTGWPNWAKFRPMGVFFTLGSFYNITQVRPSLGLLFHCTYKLCINFGKKLDGLHIGWFFSQTHRVTLLGAFFSPHSHTLTHTHPHTLKHTHTHTQHTHVFIEVEP
jgi:hypothetical protein